MKRAVFAAFVLLCGCSLRVDLESGGEGQPCFTTGECAPGLSCAAGVCVADCQNNIECAVLLAPVPECMEAICDDGACVLAEAAPGATKNSGLACDFSVEDPNLRVETLRVLDLETSGVSQVLSNGDVVDLDEDPTVVFDATVSGNVGSIVWLSNRDEKNRENSPPWGDRISSYPIGPNAIALIPYSLDGGAGIAGVPLELEVTLRGIGIDSSSLSVDDLEIVDGPMITPLTDGESLTLSGGADPTIRAVVSGTVANVAFTVDGTRLLVDNTPPFELSTSLLESGAQQLVVFPFAGQVGDSARGVFSARMITVIRNE
ncbi:MAG: hypothetical protein AAF654_06645 [Myxococcota bacterium]